VPPYSVPVERVNVLFTKIANSLGENGSIFRIYKNPFTVNESHFELGENWGSRKTLLKRSAMGMPGHSVLLCPSRSSTAGLDIDPKIRQNIAKSLPNEGGKIN
jgi:hypothetical protein